MIKIKAVKMKESAVMPTKGTVGSAGYDLYACLEGGQACTIPPHENISVGTGISIAIPEGYYGAVYARSGIASKRGLRPSNCVGVIDSDYRGEVVVSLYNDTDSVQEIENRERIAQLVITPYLNTILEEVDVLNVTDRGKGGFGSTGIN